MSLPSKEDRPKLKARRFNKFEPSSTSSDIHSKEKRYVTKQGFKRTISDDDENTSFKRKRICNAVTNYDVPPSTSRLKSLANDRLKKLKENLQAELKSKQASDPPTKISVKRESVTEILNDELRTLKKTHMENVPGTSQKIYSKFKQNSDNDTKQKLHDQKLATSRPNQLVTKNIANERLNLIKKKLSNQDDSKSTIYKNNAAVISSKIENSYYSKTKANEEMVTSRKRNISNLNNDFDKSEKSISKRLSIARKLSLDKEVDDQETCSDIRSKEQNANILSSNKPIIQDLSVKSNEKPPEKEYVATTAVESVKICEEGNSHLSPLLKTSSSFTDKMAMTASWIINNYQDNKNSYSSLEKAENSLSVNVDNSTNKLNFKSDTEDMEWTNAEPDDEVVDVNKQEIKQEINETDKQKLKDICIIVDTNVFISGLSKIQDIMDLKITGPSEPLIYIPWMVMTELDYMKDSCSGKLKKNITNSIKFINNALEKKHPRLIGQTVFEAQSQKHVGSSPDDKIISCCLQAMEKYESVILVSNDVNLKNKAMINNLMACSTHEIMMKIISRVTKTNKSQKIIHKMGIMCSSIICECAKEAYGNVWTKMDMLKCPPWSLAECLKRFKKYWGSVFREKLLKQFTKTMEELLQFLESNKYVSDDSEDFVQLMKLCITLCIFLKDIEDCRGLVENTLNEITKLA